jgi:tetratricopeptide (TPR) repeat protein
MQKIAEEITASEVSCLNWAQLVVYLTDIQHLDPGLITYWNAIFHKVVISAPENNQIELPSNVEWKLHKADQPRSKIWNQLLEDAESDWVLFLENDEDIRFNDFPTLDEINEKHWPPALILHGDREKMLQHYQIRFVPKGFSNIFEGKNLPDCTRFITQNDISLSNMPVLIERKSNPLEEVDPEDELGVQAYSPQLYLVQGQKYFKQKKYVHAAGQFRQILKADKLLPFDRLAAVNGLSSCLAEQHKWPQALALADKSLEAEPFQSLPYLIKFKIYQLQKQWDKAYQALVKYYNRINLYSRASFDVTLSSEETLLCLSDLAMHLSLREQSFAYLNDLYAMKNGKVGRDFLQQLLVLSIDLGDEKKSIYFFKRLFNEELETEFSPETKNEMNDYMSMFMKKEWFDFVYEIYNALHNKYPDDDEFKRRLIVVSVKTQRVEKARKLASRVA